MKKVSSEFWLKFFNDFLYNNKLISHDEMLKMNAKINNYVNRL